MTNNILKLYFLYLTVLFFSKICHKNALKKSLTDFKLFPDQVSFITNGIFALCQLDNKITNYFADHSPSITVMDIHTTPISPSRNPTKNKLTRLISLSPTFHYNMENVSTQYTSSELFFYCGTVTVPDFKHFHN